MTAEAAIKAFVIDNLEFLTAAGHDRKEFKRRFNAFFVDKHNKVHGLPSRSELARAVVLTLRSRGLATESIDRLIDSASFLKDQPDATRDELRELLRTGPEITTLNAEDLARIRAASTYEVVREHVTEEVTREARLQLADIEQQIAAKKEEYAAIPSILDVRNILEPDISPEVERTRPWWQRFYLRADPFLGKDGLATISQDLYEQVIIKTSPFQHVLDNLHANPNYLFGGGFLLSGGYGHGKTTIIDYLSYTLINRNIIPFRLACGRAFADSSSFADSFYQRFRKALFDEACTVAATLPVTSGVELDDQVLDLARAIVDAGKAGIVVFLDDYHKHRSHFPQVFEFLGTLQVLKDSLTRCGVNCGFIVSGLPEWRTQLSLDGQLSGFLDRPPIDMPEITADLVCQVFNKRLQAFCYESSPRTIRPDFVQQLGRELDRKAGFRDYLSKIVDELSRNNQAIVDSPLEIDSDVLSKLRDELESDPAIKSSLARLTFGSRFKHFSDQQIAKCLELLVYTHIQNGIAEDDQQFVDNQYYFSVLRDVGLIQKQRLLRKGVCEWGLQTRLKKVATDILTKYRYHLQDYLLKLYAYKGYSARQQLTRESEDEAIARLKILSSKYSSSLEHSTRDHLTRGLHLYDVITMSPPEKRSGVEQVDRAEEAVEALSQALFELDGSEPYFRRLQLTGLAPRWELHPDSSEAVQEMFSRISDFRSQQSPQKAALAIKQITNVAGDVAELLNALMDERWERAGWAIVTDTTGHDDDGLEVLRQARNLNYSSRREDHFQYVRQVTDYFELRTRRLLFFSGELLFGDAYFDKCPEALQKYAYKNIEGRTSFAVLHNKFDGLTRSQLRAILTEGNPYKDFVIQPLQLTWKRDDWELFGELFAVENIKAAHLQVDAFSPAERQRYQRYCHMVADLSGATGRQVSHTLRRSIFLRRSHEGRAEHVPYEFRCSFKMVALDEPDRMTRVFDEWPKSISRSLGSAEHLLSEDANERVCRTLRSKSTDGGAPVIQDLLDIDYISTHYRVSPAEFVCALAYNEQVTRYISVLPWFGSSVAIQTCPEHDQQSSPEVASRPSQE